MDYPQAVRKARDAAARRQRLFKVCPSRDGRGWECSEAKRPAGWEPGEVYGPDPENRLAVVRLW